jgi:hypothetical protein
MYNGLSAHASFAGDFQRFNLFQIDGPSRLPKIVVVLIANQLSGLRPRVFERRKAISGVIPLFPLISLWKVEGDTFSLAATLR